mmetsp:Transcript_69867/g.140635  ORF Transcript_69867/g.140635 Transcript_69867/m.140635 type:complete len:238 (-) Transcript_69867:197-910(-)
MATHILNTGMFWLLLLLLLLPGFCIICCFFTLGPLLRQKHLPPFRVRIRELTIVLVRPKRRRGSGHSRPLGGQHASRRHHDHSGVQSPLKRGAELVGEQVSAVRQVGRKRRLHPFARERSLMEQRACVAHHPVQPPTAARPARPSTKPLGFQRRVDFPGHAAHVGSEAHVPHQRHHGTGTANPPRACCRGSGSGLGDFFGYPSRPIGGPPAHDVDRGTSLREAGRDFAADATRCPRD